MIRGVSTSATAPARSSSNWCPRATSRSGLRAGGAGIGGFFTPTGFGTPLAEGKETRMINGVGHVFESPITADVALIKAHTAVRRTWSIARRHAISGR